MPYKNIRYIKLVLELFDDERFLLGCNDSQKLDYILWIAMAGLTSNEAKEDMQWFKTRFNLQKHPVEISENLIFLLQTFPKMYSRGGKVKFKKFRDYHNPLRNIDGTPKDSPKIKIDILEKIRLHYLKLKGWKEEDLITGDYARIHKAIKQLYLKARQSVDLCLKAIDWVNRQNYCDWTMETVGKKFNNFLSEQSKNTSKGYIHPKEKPEWKPISAESKKRIASLTGKISASTICKKGAK